MAYTARKPYVTPSADELRQSIPGWGVDLDPAVRPSWPKEKRLETGAHWDFPERQAPLVRREKSTEHAFLTPVFGTAQPLHGLSGAIRRYAYTYSEGRLAHWLLLILGDRVDIIGSRIKGLLTLRPDNPITESGVLSEFRHGAYRAHFAKNRADRRHQLLDPLVWAGPTLLAAGAVFFAVKRSRKRRRAA